MSDPTLSDDPADLAAVEAAAALTAGTLTPRALAAACRARIAARDGELRAWVSLDDAALEAELSRVEGLATGDRGPLWGLPVAVKDVFDTIDHPTTYGSEIYAGHRPAADAAVVARLRAAGAVILGKTVSTEFAYWRQGPTRNPHDTTRTPGGSSSGSAAAVAAGMAPLALGSQTAASTIRPASYCGIVGFKPSRRVLSTVGVKALAESFDTVGVLARSVGDVGLLAGVVAGIPLLPAGQSAPPSIARWKGAEWDAAAEPARAAVEAALACLAEAGATVTTALPPPPFDALTASQTRMMAAEAAHALSHEARVALDRLSPTVRDLIAEGAAQAPETRIADRALITASAAAPDPLFGSAEILAAPAAMDEAPLYEAGTGSPDLSRAFTALGLPSIALPIGRGPNALPLGLQLVARPGCDARLIAVAAWAEACLARAA